MMSEKKIPFLAVLFFIGLTIGLLFMFFLSTYNAPTPAPTPTPTPVVLPSCGTEQCIVP